MITLLERLRTKLDNSDCEEFNTRLVGMIRTLEMKIDIWNGTSRVWV